MYITYFPLTVKKAFFKDDTNYDTFTIRGETKPNQTKTKTKTKTQMGLCCCCRLIFNRRIFNRRIFNRLILCSGSISVSLGSISVSLGIISVSLGSISDILGFISDRYLYKLRSDFKAINLLDDKLYYESFKSSQNRL